MNRAINWFVHNPVAANLLMFLLLVGGALMVFSIRQEIFPEFSTDTITITVPYLGAAPEEVEEGVCIRIEEQIQGINGIKKITSKASEGSGTITIELLEDAGLDLDGLKQAFVAHNEAVIATIPADQLLVFEVKQGWEPLCEFLEAAVPAEPFPRTNHREEFWDRVNGKI